MFAQLDGLRGLLDETLKDWDPPKIIVVGQESAGKSSVLERLMMVPLLPRDKVNALIV
jgi:GTP-binding protein EngB required for normal cell division